MADAISSTVRVRYAETDQMGVVYYGNYFTYFEVGRVEWCKARGFNYRDMEREDGAAWWWPRRAAATRLRRASTTCWKSASLKHARQSVVAFSYEVRQAESGELLATGETVHFVTDANLQPRPLPEKYRALFGL